MSSTELRETATFAPIYVDGAERRLPATPCATAGLHIIELPGVFDISSYLRWRLVHHSGRQIAAARTIDRIKDAAGYLEGVTDWSRPVEDIAADREAGRIDVEEMYSNLLHQFEVWHPYKH